MLRSARLAGGVRRVVITSSTASVLTFKPPSDTSWPWSEDDWNTDTTLEDNAYRYSKTLAEQAGLCLRPARPPHPPHACPPFARSPSLSFA